MNDAFHQRLAGLDEAELRAHLADPAAYRRDAVEAVLAELDRRGCALSEAELDQVRGTLDARDRSHTHPSLFGSGPARRRRLRLLSAAILVLGLGSSILILRAATAPTANPLGYEPEDTKRYLRQMEMIGGKANVMASRLRMGFASLFQGENLAFTVATLSALLSAGFWFASGLPEAQERAGGDR